MNGDSSKSCFDVGSDPRDYSCWGRGASYCCVPLLVVLVEKQKAATENRRGMLRRCQLLGERQC